MEGAMYWQCNKISITRLCVLSCFSGVRKAQLPPSSWFLGVEWEESVALSTPTWLLRKPQRHNNKARLLRRWRVGIPRPLKPGWAGIDTTSRQTNSRLHIRRRRYRAPNFFLQFSDTHICSWNFLFMLTLPIPCASNQCSSASYKAPNWQSWPIPFSCAMPMAFRHIVPSALAEHEYPVPTLSFPLW